MSKTTDSIRLIPFRTAVSIILVFKLVARKLYTFLINLTLQFLLLINYSQVVPQFIVNNLVMLHNMVILKIMMS